MLYEEARVYLDHVSKYGSVLGLESIKGLLRELGNPQNKLTFIHIAGTNGKGSILACLSCILKEAGYKTGRYISPTVMDYRERFQIDGEYIGKEEFAGITCKVKAASDRMIRAGKTPPTVFEIETAIAFCYFAENRCDVVVMEAGLGGLLDATNVVENTKVCIFSSISMDHMGVIGNTLEEIAENKAGIIKDGAAVVSAPQVQEVQKILEDTAEKCGCRYHVSSPKDAVVIESSAEGQIFSYGEFGTLTLSLAGKHQIENAVTALEAVRVLQKEGFSISPEAVKTGLSRVEWPGRFMIIGKNPLIIADGAHNADAARRLAENVRNYLGGKKITAVAGIFKDKEYQKIVEIMAPYLSRAYTVELPDKNRTLGKEELKAEFERQGVLAETAEEIQDAVKKAAEHTKSEDAVLVFGSLSYLGEVISYVQGKEGKKW